MSSILQTIGNTPMVRLQRLAPAHVNVFVKLEAFNPMSSVKDRLALSVIEDAERTGKLKPGQTVVEATSGNTGIGLAMVCNAKGYPFVCVMSEAFSVERRKLMRFLGAKVVLVPAHLKGTGMVAKAEELSLKHGWFLAQQFVNEANARIHEETTGPEILAQLEGKKLDYLVTGYGTGGTLKGLGKYMKAKSPETEICVAEPDNSALLFSKVPTEYKEDGTHVEPHPVWRPHLIQGWTADFIPKLVDDARPFIGRLLPVGGDLAMQTAKDLAQKEGIFSGISGGATVGAAMELAKTAPQGSNIVAMVPDTGERYLSTPLFDGIQDDMSAEELDISQSTPNYRFDVQQAPPQAPPAKTTTESDEFVTDKFTSPGVVVFSLEYCEFCWSIKKLLEAMSCPYEIINVDAFKYVEGAFGASIRASLANRTGVNTFPQVIIGGEFIGGAVDGVNMFKEGQLQKLLVKNNVTFDQDYTCENPFQFLPSWLHKR